MASMQVSGAAAAGRAWGPPRRGECRRGGGVRGFGAGSGRPSLTPGASGITSRRAERGCRSVAADSRGREVVA